MSFVNKLTNDDIWGRDIGGVLIHCFSFGETRSHYVTKAGLRATALLVQLPKNSHDEDFLNHVGHMHQPTMILPVISTLCSEPQTSV